MKDSNNISTQMLIDSPKTVPCTTYDVDACAVFFRTRDPFGGFSNMSSSFPVYANGTFFGSSEALYQACRFPHLPDVQAEIMQQNNGLLAKRAAYRYLSQSRKDWHLINVRVMDWVLRVKLAQNHQVFGDLLASSGGPDRPIVEQSSRDNFWGAILVHGPAPRTLVGRNVLGRLLMSLRTEHSERPSELKQVEPPDIVRFHLFGRPIRESRSSDRYE